MGLQAGTKLGAYEIVGPIGAGGMGDVYKARDTRLDRIVAIKVSKDAFSERFEREARAIAALNHPHICQLYDVGPNYLVMEYVEGTPLQGPLPVQDVKRFAQQICEALDAAHRKGIVHRDLKPANILVTKSGVKLLDFGLAHVVASADDPTLTRAGEVMGTPAYIAPEQWEGRPADVRSDIYAFGCVLYELLTGKRAAQERVAVAPATLETVLAACLAKDPDDRWQSVRDVGHALAFSVPPEVHAPNPWRERVVWTCIVLSLLGLALYLALARGQLPAIAEVTRFSVYPPSGSLFSGPVYVTVGQPQFAVSPDGRSLVFVASTPGGRSALWLRSFDNTTARLLPGTEFAESPFWSPDGSSIGFFAEGKIKKIRVASGLVQPVVGVGEQDARGGSWSVDGTILFGTGNGPIFRVSENGGTAQPITNLHGSVKEASHRWPLPLADGRHFLFTIRGEMPGGPAIYAGSMDGTVRKFLVHNMSNAVYVPSGFLLFTNGDTLLGQAFDADRLELTGQSFVVAERVALDSRGTLSAFASHNGVLVYSAPNPSQIGRLTWFTRDGKVLGSVGAEGEYTDFRLSPDETRLAASLVDPKTGNPDIWLLDLQRGSPIPLIRGPAIDAGGVWSPDGSRLVFRTTRRGGQVEFYEKSTGGGGEETPVLLNEAQRAAGGLSLNLYISDWSPDGQRLLYLVTNSSASELWTLRLPERKPTRLLRWPSLGMHASFSPDGHLITYSSDESGKFEVYAQTFPLSDRKLPVSVGGGYEPRWRADGREIYYLSEDRTLMSVAVAPGPTFGVPKALFKTNVAAGLAPYRTHYVPSRDGQRFLIGVPTGNPEPAPITVVLNWMAGVTR